jgi:hypothetical protein
MQKMAGGGGTSMGKDAVCGLAPGAAGTGAY